MIEYKIDQLVVKIKHPDWDTSGDTAFIVQIGDTGIVEEVDVEAMLFYPRMTLRGVGVFFPRLGMRIVCQPGTVVPIEEEKGDANTVTTWDKCAWRPNLDFTKQKTV